MARTVSIGNQDFEKIRTNNNFYIDKTGFIREWWEAADEVTLITRPRRFGKTLNMNMLENFFSIDYKGREDLFQGLTIWEDKYRKLQETYPVIFLSFADIKETTFQEARQKICKIIQMIYNKFDFLLAGDVLNENEKRDFQKISTDMENYMASLSLKMLSDYLCRYYGKKVIILLDEYDTPMQEAYANGYWEEYGLSSQKQQVKNWYDGFAFGKEKDIYNPWSIINFLDKKKVGAYWVNSSSNRLVDGLVREGKPNLKKDFEDLLNGRTLQMEIDEQIVYNQLLTKKMPSGVFCLPADISKLPVRYFWNRQGTCVMNWH